MKHFYFLFLFASIAITLSAQSRFPYDSVANQVSYSQTIRLAPKVKEEEVYAWALNWFNDKKKFIHHNAIVPLDTMLLKKPNKKKPDVEDQFENIRPLQMQDPAGGKIQGMATIRYYSTANSIKLLYLKYDINIKVKSDAVTMTISNIHYFHFNAGTYKQIPLYNFSGGKPCDEVGTLEALIGCENFHEEFKALAVYCNKEIGNHFSDFKNLLRQKKYISDSKPATAYYAKAPAKTTPAKAPLKK